MSKLNSSRIHNCSIDNCIELIGGKWKIMILWKLRQHSAMRFGELRRALPTVTKKMLTQQLRQLEADQLITRQVYSESPLRVEYTLSTFGETLAPVFAAVVTWSTEQEVQVNNILNASCEILPPYGEL